MAETGMRGTQPQSPWAGHETTRRDNVTIPWGRIAGTLPHPVEITIRTRPPLRHAFIAWSPRSRLRRDRLNCTRGLHRRFYIQSHGGTVSGAVSSFSAIYIGISNGLALRFRTPELFQPIQIRVNGGLQLHELLSFFEVVKTFFALSESSAALAYSRSLTVALGSWSGN